MYQALLVQRLYLFATVQLDDEQDESQGREKERGRVVDAFDFNALYVAATGNDLISPEGKTGCIRLAVEEVSILLTNEELRVVEGIEYWRGDRQRLPWLTPPTCTGPCG